MSTDSEREEVRRRCQRSWGGQAATVWRQRTRGGQAATPAIMRRPSSDAHAAMRGTREATARQPYAMARRGSPAGDVRMCARTHESARDTCTQWQCRPTDVYNWVGWTHPHPVRYCWMHANLSILYFCIIACISFMVINVVYYHADCHVNPFIE